MPAWLNKKNAVKMRGTVSLIGEGSFFKGDMSSQADVRVEGEFHGVLHASGEVAIGERGRVRSSDLQAREVIVAGRMEGGVRAEGCVRITPTGRITGTIRAAALVIEPGAVFQGSSEMTGPEEDAPASGNVI
ncbi:polymer-forming cytoskeletal protein [Paenibacillus sp. P25]|nr:polymer-forming cytoskeletal protein [Paenibacillus sp. P25]